MKRFALIGICVAAMAAGMVACSWDTGSDAESYSSSYNWVNFSGVYRGTTTTVLDSDYEPATPGSTNIAHATERFYLPQNAGTTGPKSVAHNNLVEASFTVSVNGANFSDPDGDGVLTGDGSGVVNYGAGTWSITLKSPFINDAAVSEGSVSYAYRVVTEGTEESGTEFGTTQVDAYSFVVDHNAQYLTLTDNTGLSYSGQIGQMRSSSGAQNTDIGQVGADEEENDNSQHARYTYYESPLPENGDTIVASFECSGAGGKIVGTLSGTVVVGVFSNRRLDGTKISAGSTDDITAIAESVEIVPVSLIDVEGTNNAAGSTNSPTN